MLSLMLHLKGAGINEEWIKLLFNYKFDMYRFPFFLLLSLFNIHSTFAEKDSIAMYYCEKINTEALKRSISILSNDSLQGRETATLGQKKAEDFIASEFKNNRLESGIDGGYVQSFDLINTSLNSISLQFNDDLFTGDSQLLNYNLSFDSEIRASEIIFAGFGISSDDYDDYKGIDVKDKIVFILSGTPKYEGDTLVLSNEEDNKWNRNPDLKLDLAKSKGAKAMVIVHDDYDEYKQRVYRYLEHENLKLKQENDSVLATIIMDDKAFYELFSSDENEVNSLLESRIKNDSPMSLEVKGEVIIDIKVEKTEKSASNIISIITCSDSLAPWIVISAHYDHEGSDGSKVYHGADDNASGSSAVMELARVFNIAKEEGVKFKKNFMFLLVSGEEKGLLGSNYFVSHPSVDLDNIEVDLNLDMIGRVDNKHVENEEYVYVIGADKISQELSDINEKMNSLYTHLELDYTYNLDSDPNKFYYRSDHYNFAKNGIPVIFYFNGTHEDYHRASDTEDKINYRALLKRTQLVFYTAWYIAQKEGGFTY
jgi:hypothetical protein